MPNAEVLVLDEPTASLDAGAEYEVFRRFGDSTSGKSAVLISLRFSTMRMADRVGQPKLAYACHARDTPSPRFLDYHEVPMKARQSARWNPWKEGAHCLLRLWFLHRCLSAGRCPGLVGERVTPFKKGEPDDHSNH